MLKKHFIKDWNTQIDNIYLLLCFISAITVTAFLIIYYCYPDLYKPFDTPCIWNSFCGLYCAGCGGTRAVLFLFSGHPIQSFIYHPIPLYCSVSGILFLFGRFLAAVTHGRKNIFHGSAIWVWSVLILIILNLFLKNFCLLFFHIALI